MIGLYETRPLPRSRAGPERIHKLDASQVGFMKVNALEFKVTRATAVLDVFMEVEASNLALRWGVLVANRSRPAPLVSIFPGAQDQPSKRF